MGINQLHGIMDKIIVYRTENPKNHKADLTPCIVPEHEINGLVENQEWQKLKDFLADKQNQGSFHLSDSFPDYVMENMLSEQNPYPDVHLYFNSSDNTWLEKWENHLNETIKCWDFDLADVNHVEGYDGWEECFVIFKNDGLQCEGIPTLIRKENINSIITLEPDKRILRLDDVTLDEKIDIAFEEKQFYVGFEEASTKSGFYKHFKDNLLVWKEAQPAIRIMSIDLRIIPDHLKPPLFDYSIKHDDDEIYVDNEEYEPKTLKSQSFVDGDGIKSLNRILLIIMIISILYLFFA